MPDTVLKPRGTVDTVDSTLSLLAQMESALAKHADADWDLVLKVLFPALVAQDRKAAAFLVENFPAGDHREQLLHRLMQTWAANDFAGAVSWIATLPSLAEQKSAFDDACFAASENNPAEAIHAWESFDFKDDDHVMENIVLSWAEKDINSAHAWASARPPSLQRDQAMARIAYIMAQTKPSTAANLIIREIPPGPALTEAAISILHQWAMADLPGATAWVQQFPPGPMADRAQNELEGIAKYEADRATNR